MLLRLVLALAIVATEGARLVADLVPPMMG